MPSFAWKRWLKMGGCGCVMADVLQGWGVSSFFKGAPTPLEPPPLEPPALEPSPECITTVPAKSVKYFGQRRINWLAFEIIESRCPSQSERFLKFEGTTQSWSTPLSNRAGPPPLKLIHTPTPMASIPL
eukprot:94595-Prorocentrum_minimum.AAC.8